MNLNDNIIFQTNRKNLSYLSTYINGFLISEVIKLIRKLINFI